MRREGGGREGRGVRERVGEREGGRGKRRAQIVRVGK